MTDTSSIVCSLSSAPLDPAEMRRNLPALDHCGGLVTFEGIVRNHNHGLPVLKLEYEAYEPLALKELERICQGAQERFGLKYIRAVHRTGALAINDTAVIIQVLSHHRGEAFEGCRYIIDQIKVRVPVWKKEFYSDGTTAWTRCHEHDHEPVSLNGF